MKHDFKVYGTVVVGTKGQIVIPADARTDLNLKAGDKLVVVGSPEQKFVGVMHENIFRKFLNKLRKRISENMMFADKLDEIENQVEKLAK